MSKKVVFFFPSFASSEATAPLGILAVATPLLRNGYAVKLIDSTITENYKQKVLEEVKDALCLAISLVTGPMIRETVEIAQAVKAWNQDFPIILGGWHPLLLPEQTLEAPFIDIVVRGQGEDALLEIVQHLDNHAAIDLIPGIGFKRNQKLVFTTERLKQIVDLPPKAYHIADFDAYQHSCGRRWAMYISSLAEWADLPLGRNTLPWLKGGELERLQRMLDFFLLNNQLRKATKNHPALRNGLRGFLGAPLRWRIRSNKYSFPWELWVGKKLERS